MKFQWTMILCLIGLSIAGCEKPNKPDPAKVDAQTEDDAQSDNLISLSPSDLTTPADEADTNETTTNEVTANEITMEVKSWAEVQDWVKTQQGKVVVVDVWSTSCPPCIAEFPNFVALQNKYPEKVVCASFSLDYTGSDHAPSEKLQERILGVLKKLSATTVNFLSSDADEEATKAMEVAAIPVAFVYDTQGELAKKFTNDDGEYPGEGYTYKEHIVPLVDTLVQGQK